jgi:serine/threonine protein kinase
MEILDDYLPNLSGDESDWQFIFRTVYDVSCGLASIYGQGIVHTDMHRQNLLVTFDQTEGAVTVHAADLGEARDTANSNSLLVRESFCSTAIIPYHIDIFTSKGDMLRLASLIERMSLRHWEMKENHLSQKLIPKPLQDFLDKCRSPDDIPSSYQLAQDMDDERDEMWARQRLWQIVDLDDPTTEVLEFDMVAYKSFCEE